MDVIPNKPMFLNPDEFSDCALDHAPRGSSREEFVALRRRLAMDWEEGYPADAASLPDDVIVEIAITCARLRTNNKGLASFYHELSNPKE